MRLASTALFLGFVAVACSEKKPPPPPAPAPKADIEPVLDASVPEWPGWPLVPNQPVTAAMLCRLFLSPSADLKDQCARKYNPLESTRGYLDTTLNDCVPRLERGLANGRVEINQPAAVTCISKRMAYRQSGRTDIAGTAWEHACDGVLVGKAAAGAQCREDWECADNLACAIGRSSKIGKCTTPSALNGPCAAADLHFVPSHACATGLYCAADTCRARDKEGEGCGPYSCIEGTFCATGTHKCMKELVKAGGPCSRHDDCAVGFYCDVKKCAAQKSAGQKCLDSIECHGDCDRGACIARCGS